MPGALDPSWTRRGGQPHSVPLLPAAPAGSDDDEAHTMVRIMLEDVASIPTGLAELEAGSGYWLLSTACRSGTARTWAVSSSTPWLWSPRPNRAPRPGPILLIEGADRPTRTRPRVQARDAPRLVIGLRMRAGSDLRRRGSYQRMPRASSAWIRSVGRWSLRRRVLLIHCPSRTGSPPRCSTWRWGTSRWPSR